MECPKCGLLCPNAAQYCDCGFSIAGGPARPAFAPIPQGRELPPNPAALIVTGFGAILTVVSMFMDHLSSTQVSTIHK